MIQIRSQFAKGSAEPLNQYTPQICQGLGHFSFSSNWCTPSFEVWFIFVFLFSVMCHVEPLGHHQAHGAVRVLELLFYWHQWTGREAYRCCRHWFRVPIPGYCRCHSASSSLQPPPIMKRNSWRFETPWKWTKAPATTKMWNSWWEWNWRGEKKVGGGETYALLKVCWRFLRSFMLSTGQRMDVTVIKFKVSTDPGIYVRHIIFCWTEDQLSPKKSRCYC